MSLLQIYRNRTNYSLIAESVERRVNVQDFSLSLINAVQLDPPFAFCAKLGLSSGQVFIF